MNQINIQINSSDLLILIVVLAIGLSFQFFREKKRARLAAEYIVTHQNRIATENELNIYLRIAEENGTKDLYLKELVKLRQKYGHKNIKLGHLLFIDQKLCGRIQEDVEAPAFD